MNAVLFQLTAPLASWAETGSQYRPTDTVPTWSSLVGMVGAAKGWQRGDNNLVRLADEYAPAFQVEGVGERFVDFQTIQSPHKSTLGILPPRTRRQELEAASKADKLLTSITKREYVEQVSYQIALIALVEEPATNITEIVDALYCPIYPLYAGRRSCPLGILNPSHEKSDSLEELLPEVSHWDMRIASKLTHSLVRERRDLLIRAKEPRRFEIRFEAVR